MVCYGIGNFSFSRQAGYQFALLLLLRQYLQLKEPVYIFEPLFTELEREILPSYGCEVIKNNEEAKRPVKKPTLFFMPHVDRCLYSNLLWANWSEESLSNLIILGNSFQHYDERIVSQVERQKTPYLFKALNVMEETSISSMFGKMKEAFTDLSVIDFTRRKFDQTAEMSVSFWERCLERDLPSQTFVFSQPKCPLLLTKLRTF